MQAAHIGTVHGNRIDLEEPIDLPQGTRVRVVIQPLAELSSLSLIGLLAEDAEILDAVLETVMHERETRPMREDDGESLT